MSSAETRTLHSHSSIPVIFVELFNTDQVLESQHISGLVFHRPKSSVTDHKIESSLSFHFRGHEWVKRTTRNTHIHSDVQQRHCCWIPVTFSPVQFLIRLVRLEPFTVDAFSAWSDFAGGRYRYKSLTIHLPVLAYPYINKLLGASCKSEDKWNRSANHLWQKPGGISIRRDQASLRWTCHLNDGYSSARLSFQIDNQTKSAGSLAGGSVKTVITGRCFCCCCYISNRVKRDRARVLDKMTAL